MDEPQSTSQGRSGQAFAPLGAHEYAIAGGEGPDGGDVVQVRIHGAVSVSDINLLLETVHRIAERHRRAFLIVHMIGPGGIDPAARRHYIEWRRQHPATNRYVYVISSTVLVRTLVALILRGTKLITGYQPQIQLVGSESEALTRIAEVRKRP